MVAPGRNAPCPCGSGKKYKLCHGKLEQRGGPRLVSAPKKDALLSPGVVILMPTRGRVSVETLVSFSHLDGLPAIVCPVPRKGIVDARNDLAQIAQRAAERTSVNPSLGWYALWVDDDAFWRPGTITKLLHALQRPGVDIIAGWFCSRSPHSGPKCFRDDGTYPVPGDGFEDGDIIEVAHVGFHFVMHKVSALEKLGDNPFRLEGTGQLGEDLAFCERARAAGLRVWVHTGAPVAHIDDDGFAYLPGEGPMRVVGTVLEKVPDQQREYGGLQV